MSFVVRNGLEIHYELKGEGEPVLFLPGVFSHRLVWGPVTRRLGGIQAILMDHRDSGMSSLSPAGYTIRELALDALAVLDHAGVASSHLVGHSMGGAVALEMALAEPQRVASLVLVNSWAKTDVYSGSVFRLMSLLRSRLTDDREFLQANTFVVNSAAPLQFMSIEDVAQSILNYGGLQTPAALQRNLAAAGNFDVLDRLPVIQSPALVIWGDEDKVFPAWHARELAQSIPQARELRLEGVGHMAVFQAADRVAGAIREFVK
jgi:pimeloyl-ACP methyl ester carboxylesterase